jgi:hypothetical protein
VPSKKEAKSSESMKEEEKKPSEALSARPRGDEYHVGGGVKPKRSGPLFEYFVVVIRHGVPFRRD